MPGVSFFFLDVSIDALDRISLMVDCIVTPTIIGLVFMRGLFLGMGASFNFSFVVWASIFSCTAVGWKDFLCLYCCLNRCCWGQVASGSRGKVPRPGGPFRYPMRLRTFAQVEHRV